MKLKDILLMASDMKRLIVFLFVLLTLQTVTAGDRLSMLPCHILGGELSNSAATSVQDIDEAMPRMRALGLHAHRPHYRCGTTRTFVRRVPLVRCVEELYVVLYT